MADKKTSKETKPAKKTAQAAKVNPAVKFFKDLKSEFKKVVWPSKKTVVNNTGAVLAAMAVCGLAIWGLDSLYAVIVRGLFSLAG